MALTSGGPPPSTASPALPRSIRRGRPLTRWWTAATIISGACRSTGRHGRDATSPPPRLPPPVSPAGEGVLQLYRDHAIIPCLAVGRPPLPEGSGEAAAAAGVRSREAGAG